MKCRILASLLALAACASGPETRPETAGRRLRILHVSDLEGEMVGAGSVGGLGRLAGTLEALRRQSEAPVITVAAGDTFMPAPALAVEVEGRSAVFAGNDLLGLQASTLGNHEFDRGEAFLAAAIGGASFPYLTATVDFDGGPLDAIDVEPETLADGTYWLEAHPGRVLPRGLLCAGGRVVDGRCTGMRVGVVGATTETLGQIASTAVRVGVAADAAELLARVQREVDALVAEGVDVVVLLSHLQDVRADLDLVEMGLVGVDVIVSGGGDDRLADPGDRLLPDDEPHALCAGEASCYPLLRRARDGSPVAVVATRGQMRYVGSLDLVFDERGRIASVDPRSRPWPVDEQTLAELGARVPPRAAALEAAVRQALQGEERIVVTSGHLLNGERDAIRNRETNLGNLSADSLVWAARMRRPGAAVAFGLRNGGGIRSSLGAAGGAITALEIREAFRFDNELVLVTTTRRALVESLESSLRGAGTSRGHFPQVSAEVRLAYDPAAPEQVHRIEAGEVVGVEQPGQRLRFLSVSGEVLVEEGRLVGPEEPITFVTLSYLARGGDGWFPGAAGALAIEPLGMGEQQALTRYLEARLAEGSWADGAAYVDPDPSHPGTFGRILRRDQ